MNVAKTPSSSQVELRNINTISFDESEISSLREAEVRNTDFKLETIAPKPIGKWQIFKNNIRSLLPCVSRKYINIRKDGLCLFRCQLVFLEQDLKYAFTVSTNDTKKIVFDKFDEEITQAIEQALEFSMLHTIAGQDVNPIKFSKILKDNIEFLWSPEGVVDILKFYLKDEHNYHLSNYCNRKEKAQRLDAATFFSEAFFTFLFEKFQNEEIVSNDNHYMLNRRALKHS